MKPIQIAAFCALLAGVAHAECVLGTPLAATRHLRISAVVAGKPFEGAKVFFRPTEGCICGSDIFRGHPFDTSAIPPEFWRLTDANGVAELPELAVGDYDVGVTVNDVATSFIQISVGNKNEVSAFKLDVGSQLERVESVPVTSHVAAFQGVARDPGGAAISGPIVVVRKGSQGRDVVLRTKTDAQGRFSVDLSEGSYIAVFFSPQFRPAIVPFQLMKEGSKELQVTLNVASCP